MVYTSINTFVFVFVFGNLEVVEDEVICFGLRLVNS